MRAVQFMNVDLAILQEINISDEKYTSASFGYEVLASKADTVFQGGISLAYRTSRFWTVDSIQKGSKCYIIFASNRETPTYIPRGIYPPPPCDTTTIECIHEAMERLPTQNSYILLGDLNMNLRYQRDDRVVAVAATVASFGLVDMLGHFRERKKFWHGMKWQMRRRERIIMSRCDYIFSTDRIIFSNVTIREPRHYTTDGYMIFGILFSEPMKAH
jgi:hypothetical protein